MIFSELKSIPYAKYEIGSKTFNNQICKQIADNG
jgi:hypothetical protein